ncbi:MAG: molecular chaperone TorD family protein [Thermodesulfobacteriota bacterium]|nr:molecular chaperone TorD family protein [Thermodesulfobacteriota bacterium]
MGDWGQNIVERPAAPDQSHAVVLENCFFFSALLFRYPDDAVYHGIRENLQTFSDFLSAYGGQVPQVPPSEDLQAEYVGLFVNNKGFVPAVPYAAYHIDDGRLMGDSYDRLRQTMAETGFQLDPSVKELEDHLTILLEYAATLVRSVAGSEGADTGGHFEARALVEVTGNYIQPVIEAILPGIDQYATLDFYRIAARALREFIRDTAGIYEIIPGFPENAWSKKAE